MLNNQTRAFALAGLAALAACKSTSNEPDANASAADGAVRSSASEHTLSNVDFAQAKALAFNLYKRDRREMREALAGGDLPHNPMLAAQVHSFREMQAAPGELRSEAEIRSDAAQSLRNMLDGVFVEANTIPDWKNRAYRISIADHLAIINPGHFSKSKLELYERPLGELFILALPYSQPYEERTAQSAAQGIRHMTDSILRSGYENVDSEHEIQYKLSFADAVEAIDPKLKPSRLKNLQMDLKSLVQFSNDLVDALPRSARR